MFIIAYLRHALVLLIAVSVALTTYLYLYPAFHGCAFPSQQPAPASSTRSNVSGAPFRLLALGDPQLEGDSSLTRDEDTTFPAIAVLWRAATGELTAANAEKLRGRVLPLVAKDVWRIVKTYRKRLDLLGNDYYLAHIYRTLRWWTQPTHVTVLGDLIGSQWVTDEEFERRGSRFWNRVFKKGQRVKDEVTGHAGVEILGADEGWNSRVINVAGNHDVGYAGDLSRERLVRFERVFGRANWEVVFRVPKETVVRNGEHRDERDDSPELRVVVLNSLNLDTPARDSVIQTETYDFLNQVITASRPVEDKSVGTILLTHLPLHKEAGICVDEPFFDFHSREYGGGLKEQNHMSYDAGRGILEGLFGMSSNPDAPGGGLGRKGIVLTGHDHEGCDVYHHLSPDAEKDGKEWKVRRWADAASLVNESIPGVREITVRSMMGDYGGNAGLLSAWYDSQLGRWYFEYSTCVVGTQHIWWFIHILDLITLIGVMTYYFVSPYGLMNTDSDGNDVGVVRPRLKSTEDSAISDQDNRGIGASTQRAQSNEESNSVPRNRRRDPLHRAL
ncbi:MAG: hypothetical protein M1812_006716 [Candelaria pacifica]|nr:MAG: hypothetical protein M1812_006716 [Candelaria pacifica]